MTIIPLPFSIHRDPTTGKKLYTSLSTKETSITQMNLPKDWTSSTFQGSNKPTPSYAIRPDDDLVVIDCDDLKSTQAIDSLLTTTQDSYIVISDKGEKHFYFLPTDYYRSSRIYRTSRIKAGQKIDVLHGPGCYVFASCALNTTKHDHQGSLQQLTEIPDNIVDYLVSQLSDSQQSYTGDYSPVTSYLAPLAEQSLSLYARSSDYRDIRTLMQLITPIAFRDDMAPDYHPDRVPHGMGIEYLKGVRAKLGRDPSINIELATEIITLISQRFWSSPLDNKALRNITEDLTSRTYPDGRPVFVYDPDATSMPLISMNGYPYMPLYRTLDDEFVIAKINGQVELIKGMNNFKKAVTSKNFSLMFDKTIIKTQSAIQRVTENLETVKIFNLPHSQPGIFDDHGTLVYNTYVPTKYLSIIRGDYMEDQTYQNNSTPTIDNLLYNVTMDHPADSRMTHKLEQFIAHKLKTLDYSPIVFQLMGNRGTGKGSLMTLLNIITNSTARTKLNANNSQFNADTASKMFLNEDEGFVTSNLVNSLKELSGNKEIRIEGKGKDAIMVRNIGTYIFSSNQAQLLAETIDDRRFVTLSSFTAEKLVVADLENKLAEEAEQWCLKLRDMKLTSLRLYTDATMWHDDIHASLFKERTDNVQDAPGQLAYLITTQKNSLTGEQLKKHLADILGVDFHYTATGKGIKIYLANKSTRPTRLSDGASVSHNVRSTDIKNTGLAAYLKSDKNMTLYDKRIEYIFLDLSPHQLEAFEQTETVAPIDLG